MAEFNVTFETVTPESSESGDFATSGFIVEDVPLREALDHLDIGLYVEANCYPVKDPRWFTFYGYGHDYTTGATENRSLHLPDSITESSKQRIAKLIGCSNA